MKLKQRSQDFIVEELPNFKVSQDGSYSYYRLKKTGYNSEKAISIIAKRFSVPRKFFSYAGNKDKRAVTTQYFSSRKKIADFSAKGLEISFMGKGDEPISLGDHDGNRFNITVRDIEKKPEPRTKFINYFGDQRFGKNNFGIGLSILKKDFKKAVSMIDIPAVWDHIKDKPNDFVGALQKAPFKLLKLYIHSVQSYIWNKAAQLIEADELPLVAFDTEFATDDIEKIYHVLLEKHNLSLRDFIVRQIPNLTPKGSMRDRIATARQLQVGSLEEDELNPGKKKIILEFILDKGSYATVFIKSLNL